MPYLVLIFFLLIPALLWDVSHMRGFPGVGWRYLGHLEYWLLVVFRWIGQFAVAGGAFLPTWLVMEPSVALYVVVICESAGVAFGTMFGESASKGSPYNVAVFGRIELWKSRIAAEIAAEKEVSLRRRLESDVNWLLRHFGAGALNDRYKSVVARTRGLGARKDANKQLRAWRGECNGDNEMYRARVARGIAELDKPNLFQRIRRR